MTQSQKTDRYVELRPEPRSVVARMSDVASFWGVLLVTAAAVAAIALATPIVLAISAALGLVAGNDQRSTWRPVRIRS